MLTIVLSQKHLNLFNLHKKTSRSLVLRIKVMNLQPSLTKGQDQALLFQKIELPKARIKLTDQLLINRLISNLH
jgi:hypothetical protein